MTVNELFSSNIEVVNIGLESFSEAVRDQDHRAVHVEWTPPAGADDEAIACLDRLAEFEDRISIANEEAFRRINAAEPELVDIVTAGDVLPELDDHSIGHAGPPLKWEDMCGPLQGAILGAAVYEGMANTLEEAEQLVLTGKIRFISNHSMGCVGPMTGMITKSMPLFAVRNKTFGNMAYSTFNEGLGKVMRFGANGPEVIERLRWIQNDLGPAVKKALEITGPVSLKVMISKALAMGDEMHQRNIAASCLFVRTIMPGIVRAGLCADSLAAVTDFITGNDQFFLNLAMAAGKATMDPVKNIEHSCIVTAMSRNGTNFGIKVSALGDRWFESPVLQPKGLYFPGYSEKDANPDIGDSAICETFGIGGVAMGSAPAVIRFVGAESVSAAIQYSRDMFEVTQGQSDVYLMPTLDFAGTGTGFDIRKVTETGILPVINTGMAHRQPGIGQVGAGIVNAPMGCFIKALKAFAEYEAN